VLALAAGTARAHQSSMTYSDVVISADQRAVDYTLRISVRDLGEALGKGTDYVPTDGELQAGTDALFDYVLARVILETGVEGCTAERRGVSVLEQRERFAELRWQLWCPELFTSFAIEYHLFFELDALHTGNLRVRLRNETAVAPIQGEHRRFEWPDLGYPPPSGWLGFVRLGTEHILTGYDHVCFLIGLLLVAVIARPRGRAWQTRPVAGALRYTAGIVTAFTAAHSITLAAAAVGLIELPGRLVESVIAASIVYVAIENLFNPEARYRWALTFGFGLIHGLGFASVLGNLLPPDEALVPLLSFNLGVELGQLGIVIVLVPVLHLLSSRVLGAGDYRRYAVNAGSGAIAVLGTIWLIERVLDISIS
jgi:hypothetical protein